MAMPSLLSLTGSILNLSQGKFGKFTEKDVKWLAGVGTDYGAIAVNADSPIKDLAGLVAKLKSDPKSISFGAGGSVGGQGLDANSHFGQSRWRES